MNISFFHMHIVVAGFPTDCETGHVIVHFISRYELFQPEQRRSVKVVFFAASRPARLMNGRKDILISLLSVVFGGMYVNVGVQHFTDTAWFEPIVPAVLGDPTIWVLITGVMEIAIGVGLISSMDPSSCGAWQLCVSHWHLLGEPQHVDQRPADRWSILRQHMARLALCSPNWHDWSIPHYRRRTRKALWFIWSHRIRMI